VSIYLPWVVENGCAKEDSTIGGQVGINLVLCKPTFEVVSWFVSFLGYTMCYNGPRIVFQVDDLDDQEEPRKGFEDLWQTALVNQVLVQHRERSFASLRMTSALRMARWQTASLNQVLVLLKQLMKQPTGLMKRIQQKRRNNRPLMRMALRLPRQLSGLRALW